MPTPLALSGLESAVLDACGRQREWPAQVAAGVYAGVDYAVRRPEVVHTLAIEPGAGAEGIKRYETVIGRLAGFLQARAPVETRRPGSTDEALVAGVVGLVGDHLRMGRLDRLVELRPELVLLTLLPYLGFEEAQEWAEWADRSASRS